MSTPSLLNIPYLYKAGTLYSQIPESGAGDFTVSRTTTVANRSTRINKDGFIETVLDNVPRLDYPVGGAVNGCPALLVEPAATNSIRNNSMVGAVAGTPGTLPTNWNESNVGGLNRQIVGIGFEDGVEYIDYRISGTSTTTTSRLLAFEAINQIVAASGQIWTHSLWVKVISQPSPPAAYEFGLRTANAAGTPIGFIVGSLPITSSWQRLSRTSTALGATVERVQPVLAFTINNGVSYDFTIRIGYPQMEQGTVATSVIPTTTAPVTRSADVIRKTNIPFLIGQSEGTVYFEVEVTAEARDKWICTIDSSSLDYIQLGVNPSQRIFVSTIRNNVTVGTTMLSSVLTVGYHKVAYAYNTATNGCEMFIDGVQNPVLSRTISVMPLMDSVSVGGFRTNSGDSLKAHIRALELHPNRLTNAQLATLTAL